MTIKQMLEAAKARLAELKEAIEADDAEAIAEGEELVEKIAELEEKLAEADRKAALLGSIKSAEPVKTGEDKPARTLGEFAAKSLDFTGIRNGSSKSAGTGFGFKAATDVHMSTPVQVVDQRVVDIARRTDIRELFGAETISGTSLKYFVLGTAEGAPTTVAEGAQKPQFHIPYTPATATLQKIAGWYYETDELIEDNAFLRSSIDNRGMYELDKAIEGYLMTTLLATSGIGTIAQAPTADNIFQAIMQVKTASDYDADAIVINPADYQTLRLAKDGGTSGQYYGGGYFYGPYGNGDAVAQPGLWGLKTVVSNAVASGTVLVGAFAQGASVISKAGEGARVEVVTGDHEDRTNNRVTVVVEERLALATRVPGAFVKISA